jgi:hypothetical protein
MTNASYKGSGGKIHARFCLAAHLPPRNTGGGSLDNKITPTLPEHLFPDVDLTELTRAASEPTDGSSEITIEICVLHQ